MSECRFCFDPTTGDCYGDASELTWQRRRQMANSILRVWPEQTRKKFWKAWAKVRALVLMLDSKALSREIAETQSSMAEEFSPPVIDEFADDEPEKFAEVPA